MTDRNEIVAHNGGGLPVDQRMTMLREAMLNPDVDPAKARAMADLIFQMDDRDRQAEFNRDKVAAIAEMPRIFQAGKSNNHRYAKFEDMHRKVRPVLDRFNIQISFDIGSTDKGVSVAPILSHRNGITERGSAMVGPPDTGGSKSPVQAVASTASYLKRHTMKAMLNIIEGGEDDDGAGDVGREMTREQAELIEGGRTAALDGSAAYEAWFKALPAAARGWLAMEGQHDDLKAVAAKVSA